jgi:hypothetical protein
MAAELPPWSDRWEWDAGANNQVGLGAVVSRSTGFVSGLPNAVSNLALSWLLSEGGYWEGLNYMDEVELHGWLGYDCRRRQS